MSERLLLFDILNQILGQAHGISFVCEAKHIIEIRLHVLHVKYSILDSEYAVNFASTRLKNAVSCSISGARLLEHNVKPHDLYSPYRLRIIDTSVFVENLWRQLEQIPGAGHLKCSRSL